MSYSFNGVALNDAAGRWYLDWDSSRRGLPAKRSGRLAFPMRNGEVGFASNYGVGKLAMSMVVSDKDASGVSKGAAQAAANLEVILGVFGQTGLARIEETFNNPAPAQPYTRYTFGEVTASADAVEQAPSLLGYVVKILVEVPGSVWFQTTPQTPVLTLTEDVVTELTQFAGVTAPVTAGVVRVKPSEDTVSVCCVNAEGDIIADFYFANFDDLTKYFYIDFGKFDAWASSSASAWSKGGLPSWEGYDFSVAPFRLQPTIQPDASTKVFLKSQSPSGTATAQVAFRAERAYL